MESIATTHAWEVLCVDWIGPILPAVHGNKYILIFIDYHTRWVEAFPSKKKDSYTFAEYLQKSIIPRYGVPSKLLSDRDPAFLGNVACPDEWHYRSS
jgi:hypothetical protein